MTTVTPASKNEAVNQVSRAPLTHDEIQALKSRPRWQLPVEPHYHLWVGLPLETLSGDEAESNRAQIKAFLQRTHEFSADGQAVRVPVAQVTVASQPVGALYDYVLDDAGAPTASGSVLLKRQIGVVNVGMNTIELLVVSDGVPDTGMVQGKQVGVRRLLALAARDDTYSLAELDDQLRRKQLDLSIALPIWADEVKGYVEAVWGKRHKHFAAVLAVGGGAELLRPLLTRLFGGKLVLPAAANALTATAHGLYKMAVGREGRKPSGRVPLAFDAGFGNSKLWGPQGAIVMQSAVATNGARALLGQVGLKTRRVRHIENEFGAFIVGPGAHSAGRPLESMDLSRLLGGPELAALFHGALAAYLELEADA